MAVNYAHITGPAAGADNMGGTKQYFYWAPSGDFTAIQALSSSPTTFANLVEITTDHTFSVGRGFAKIYCTLDMGELNIETVGELDGRAVRPEATAFLPGDSATDLGMLKQMTNDYGIFLIPLVTSSGATKYFQIGQEDLWGFATTSFTSAKNSEGVKGTTITITSFQVAPIIYSGTVTEIP